MSHHERTMQELGTTPSEVLMEMHAFKTLLSGIKVSTGLGGFAAHYEREVVLEALTTEDFERLLRGETVDVTQYVEEFYVNAAGTPFHAVLS